MYIVFVVRIQKHFIFIVINNIVSKPSAYCIIAAYNAKLGNNSANSWILDLFKVIFLHIIFYLVDKSPRDMQTVSMVTWSGCQMPNKVMSFTLVISHRMINSTTSRPQLGHTALNRRQWCWYNVDTTLSSQWINAHATTPSHAQHRAFHRIWDKVA